MRLIQEQVRAIVPYPREIVVWLLCFAKLGDSLPAPFRWFTPLKSSDGSLAMRRRIGSFFLDTFTGKPYLGYDFFEHGVRNIFHVRFARLFFSNLQRVVIPRTVTRIGPSAFEGLRVAEVVISDSVTTIERYAFYWCVCLREITFPDSVTFIGHGAFCQCNRLAKVTFPDSITKIARYAFHGCNMLAEAEVPHGATVDEHAFGPDTRVVFRL